MKLSVTYNYELLLKKMKEKRYSQETLAPAINMSRTSLNQKLNSKSNFTQSEILRMAKLLEIPNDDVREYFFKAIVQKAEQREEVR